MKIADIRDANMFQSLVHRLMVAERGADFHVPDDSGGDRGNDGYDATKGILYAIYCPEKPDTADYRRKALSDLKKAIQLASEPGYSVRQWIFVTPTPIREQLQAEIRATAGSAGLNVGFLADVHLEDLLRRHPHIRDELPDMEYPQVARQLDAIRAPLSPLRVFLTLESQVPDEDLERVFAKDAGYRRYSSDGPLPPPPDGPPPGTSSCRLFQSDGFLDIQDGKLVGAGLIHLMGPGFPFNRRPASHTVCRISGSSLKDVIGPNEPLCMHPEIVVEIRKGSEAGQGGAPKMITFRSKMDDARKVLRLSAIDNTVFADFLTDNIYPLQVDGSKWSHHDLSGATLRIRLRFFFVEGLACLPESSWPRLNALQLLIDGLYVISMQEETIATQLSGHSTEVQLTGDAVSPTIELEYTLPPTDFVQTLSQS
ncbi:MAG: hypothetical protein GC165_00115 [Armatimonadetes bacterium]|nr:hypothetical protein [Armatimonadota bacterium]